MAKRNQRKSDDEEDREKERKETPECPIIYKIIKKKSHLLMAQMVKNLSAMWETQVPSLGHQKIPWRREWQLTPGFLPGKSHGQRSFGLQSMGSQRVGHN